MRRGYMAGIFDFDGCAICSAVKDGERKGQALSELELRQAFRVQAEKQRADVKKQQQASHPKRELKPSIRI
jgi:hypothetical protein